MGISGPRFSCHEVTRAFTTSVLLRRESAAQECSATELQRLKAMSLVGIEPTTEVSRTFTTPQTFFRFFVTHVLPYFSPSNTHTRSVFTEARDCSPSHKQKQIREELALTD
jgi:hypothetical protein